MNKANRTPEAQPKPSSLKVLGRFVHHSLLGLAAITRLGWSAAKAMVAVALILGLLATNIATIAIEPVQRLLSTGYDMATGATSVNKRLRTQAINSEERLLVEQAKSAKLTKAVKVQGAELKRLGARSGEVRAITQRITKRTVKSASLSVESLVPMAVPAVGIAAIVGFTALDLKWSCENLMDLRALEGAFETEVGQGEATDVTRVCGLKVPTKDEVWDQVKSMPNWFRD